ncbi:UNVERIFIED_CONTAM: hypothetical protein RMT77_016889 [Armadillidium vulgare]
MYQLCTVILINIFLVLPPSALSSPRLQFSIPKEDLLSEISEEESYPPSEEFSKNNLDTFESPESAARLRNALQSLLRLNDGELESLMKGMPLEQVKTSLSPSTAFFLQASKSRFERVRSLISEREKSIKLLGDLQIARRNKKQEALGSETIEEKDYQASGDSDSLLGALTELSESLQKKKKGRKSGRKHKRHLFHSSGTEKKIHYSYWLKPEECPSSEEGFPQVHCPSASKSGEWICVEDQDLCDGFSHCPNHEDEEPNACLYFKAMQNYVDLLVSALVVSQRS